MTGEVCLLFCPPAPKSALFIGTFCIPLVSRSSTLISRTPAYPLLTRGGLSNHAHQADGRLCEECYRRAGEESHRILGHVVARLWANGNCQRGAKFRGPVPGGGAQPTPHPRCRRAISRRGTARGSQASWQRRQGGRSPH